MPKASAGIAVMDVTAVTNTLSTQAGRDAMNRAGKTNRCVSVVGNTRTLDLECPNHEVAARITALGEFAVC